MNNAHSWDTPKQDRLGSAKGALLYLANGTTNSDSENSLHYQRRLTSDWTLSDILAAK